MLGVTDASRHLKRPHTFVVTVLRFRHLSHHFLKDGVFANNPVSKVLHFFQSVWLKQRVVRKIRNGQGVKATAVPP